MEGLFWFPDWLSGYQGSLFQENLQSNILMYLCAIFIWMIYSKNYFVLWLFQFWRIYDV